LYWSHIRTQNETDASQTGLSIPPNPLIVSRLRRPLWTKVKNLSETAVLTPEDTPESRPEPITEIVPLWRKWVKDRRLMIGAGLTLGLRRDTARMPCQLEGAAWHPGGMSAARACASGLDSSHVATGHNYAKGSGRQWLVYIGHKGSGRQWHVYIGHIAPFDTLLTQSVGEIT